MLAGMGYGVYIFVASMLVCARTYAFFFIQETKGLRMDQMDALFGFVRPGTNYAAKAMDDAEFQVDCDEKSAATARAEVV